MKFDMKKWLPRVLPLGELKLTLGHKIYGNALFLPMGLIGWIRWPKDVFKDWWFSPLFVLISGIDWILFGGELLWQRMAYLLCLAGLIPLIKHCFDRNALQSFVRISLFLGLSIWAFEFVIGHKNPNPKSFFRLFDLPQYFGVVGEPNFSGLVSLCLASLSIYLRWNLGFILSAFLILMTGSKGAVIGAALLFLSAFTSEKGGKILAKMMGLGLVLYPILIKLVFMLFRNSPKWIIWFEKKSSGRFILHNAYIDLSLVHPLGLGHFKAPFYLDQVYPPYLQFAEVVYQKIDFLEQHNLFVQVLSEAGPLGYFAFAGSLLVLIWKSAAIDPLKSLAFCGFLSGCLYLNALSFAPLYIWLGLLAQKPAESVQSTG